MSQGAQKIQSMLEKNDNMQIRESLPHVSEVSNWRQKLEITEFVT